MRWTHCPACDASTPRASAFCVSCGRPIGALVELDELGNGEPAQGADVAMRSTGGRRRNLVIGLAVALVVGAIVVLGTTDSAQRAVPVASSTTSTASADTTLAAAPLQPTIIGNGRPLLGEPSGLAILLAGYNGDLQRIDLDTGELIATHFASSPGQESRSWFLIEDGLLYTNGSGLVLRKLDGTERTLFSQSADNYNTFAKAGRGQIWAMSQTGAASTSLRRIDLAAASVVESVSIGNAYLIGTDETGRPLLQLADTTVWRYGADQQWTRFGTLATRPLGHGLYLGVSCPTPPACVLEVRGSDQHVMYTLPTSGPSQQVDVAAAASNGTLTALAHNADQSAPGGFGIDVLGVDGTKIATFADLSPQYDQGGAGGLTWSADGTWLIWLGLVKAHAWRFGLAHPVDIDLTALPVPVQHLAVIASH